VISGAGFYYTGQMSLSLSQRQGTYGHSEHVIPTRKTHPLALSFLDVSTPVLAIT